MLQKKYKTAACCSLRRFACKIQVLTLMKDSGCIGIFFGLETFGEHSLRDAKKKQNSVTRYKQAVKAYMPKGLLSWLGSFQDLIMIPMTVS
jgi:hypothetical protein